MALTFEERVQRMMDPYNPLPADEWVSVREVLTTKDASVLIPQVIVGVMREAAEPLYIGTSLLQRVNLKQGRSITIPSVGEIRAHDIPEGGPYPEEELEFQLHEATGEIKVGKTGLIVRVTDEMINESQWDVISLMLRKAGRAMARLKEEKAFSLFSRSGFVVFDNKLKAQYPEAATTGRDFHGRFNDTMSVDDFIDMILVLMANGFTPTDVLMHPLTWLIFAKQDVIGTLSFGALGAQPSQFQLNPNSVQGRIPFPITLNFSPFMPFDRQEKVFDMFVVDRNEVGILLVKEDIYTERWTDPERDIQNIKVREQYGLGLLHNGKAVTVARNIAFKLAYPIPERTLQLDAANVESPPEVPFN